MTSADTERVVVVGGGVAAHMFATSLRTGGFGGIIDLISAENEGPYDRPSLSKGALTEASTSSRDFGVDYGQIGVTLHTGTRTTAVEGHVVHSTSGEHPYDHLVLATGSDPLLLPGQRESPTAYSLRTRADAARIRGALTAGARIAIVGAGWIGAEVAAAAVTHGCEVTVIDAAEAPLATALPTSIGARTLSWYHDAGVMLRLGTSVDRITPTGVLLGNGDEVVADAVVVGVGARPSTSYLNTNRFHIRTEPDGSVVVDRHLRATASNVYAVGDIATWPSSRFGLIRTEHWDHAVQSGVHVARALLGDQKEYDPVPYIWSDQWGHRLQLVGHPSGDDQLVVYEGDGPDGWVAWWTSDSRIVATLAVDQPRLIRSARRSIERGDVVDDAVIGSGAHPWSSVPRVSVTR